MRAAVLLGIIVALVSTACGRSTPVSPAPGGVLMQPGGLADSSGVQKQPIRGTIQLTGIAPPARILTTPGGMCHNFDLPEFTVFDGDVQGPVTFQATGHFTCENTHLMASGPFEGQVTFHGRTGVMAGQWETNCKLDESTGTLSCGGTMNARGEGDLEGVQFHFTWGPGWWPFPYSGTAFSQQ